MAKSSEQRRHGKGGKARGSSAKSRHLPGTLSTNSGWRTIWRTLRRPRWPRTSRARCPLGRGRLYPRTGSCARPCGPSTWRADLALAFATTNFDWRSPTDASKSDSVWPKHHSPYLRLARWTSQYRQPSSAGSRTHCPSTAQPSFATSTRARHFVASKASSKRKLLQEKSKTSTSTKRIKAFSRPSAAGSSSTAGTKQARSSSSVAAPKLTQRSCCTSSTR